MAGAYRSSRADRNAELRIEVDMPSYPRAYLSLGIAAAQILSDCDAMSATHAQFQARDSSAH